MNIQFTGTLNIDRINPTNSGQCELTFRSKLMGKPTTRAFIIFDQTLRNTLHQAIIDKKLTHATELFVQINTQQEIMNIGAIEHRPTHNKIHNIVRIHAPVIPKVSRR